MPPDDRRSSLPDDPSLRATLADVERGLAELTGDTPVSPQPAAAHSRRRPLVDLFPLANGDDAAVPVVHPVERRHWGVGARQGKTAPYRSFYGLREDPFSLAPDPRFVFRSRSHDAAAQSILDAIRNREGIALLTGDPGVGKTTLCRALVEELDRRTLVSHAVDPSGSIEELLRTALVDFGVVSTADAAWSRMRRAGAAELATAVRDFAVSLERLDAFAVIIVDEGQRLTAEALEQIRLLTVGETMGRGLQVLLVGTPDLAAKLEETALRPVADSIAVRCRLDPLSADEVGDYIAHRLAVAGDSLQRVEFDLQAVRRIHEATGGVPALVNVLCDRVLTAAAAQESGTVDRDLVRAAAGELDALGVTPRLPIGRIALAGLIALLALAGAAAAAWVFRADVAALLRGWQEVPAMPAHPPIAMPTPLGPVEPGASG